MAPLNSPLWLSPLQSQRSSLTLQPQQNPLSAPLYNTMMIPQQSSTNVVQIATSLAQNTGPNTPAVATFAQERATQIRQVLLTMITTVSFVQRYRRHLITLILWPLTGSLLLLSCSPSW